MKLLFYIVTLFFAIPSTCYLQELRDYNWQLGNKSDQSISEGIQMIFSEEGLTIDTFHRSIGFEYFNASISDSNGNPILYSNGCQIRDGNHQYIEGTNHLNPGETDIEWCSYGYPVAEGGLFIPFYGDSIVMLLHQRVKVVWPPVQVIHDSLFYTSVVKKDNNYVVLEKTVPIVGDKLTGGNIEGIKANKSGAWWIIQGEKNSNRYFKILLDSAKVDTVIAQSIGDSTFEGSAAGQAVFSPDGSTYARYSPEDDLFLFDFDRASSLLSNYRRIHVADSGNIGGIAFSPNSRFLYVSSTFDLYQFDTWSDNIEASKIHIGHYDGYLDPFPTNFYHMQLGPDCRIYMNSNNSGYSWHVIHEPDRFGLDCRFEQHGIHFPVSTSITIPNFPNYRLDVNSVCDPNLVSSGISLKTQNQSFTIYPNPADEELWIIVNDYAILHKVAVIEIRDVSNKPVLTSKKELLEETSLQLANLHSGLYVISIIMGQHRYVYKLVKI